MAVNPFPTYSTESLVPVDKRNIQDIIGLPPLWGHGFMEELNERYVLSSFPIVRIIPAWPTVADRATSGLHLYSLNSLDGSKEYAKVIYDSIPTEGDVPKLLLDFKNKAEKAIGEAGSSVDNAAFRSVQVAYLNEAGITETFNQEYGSSVFEELANVGSDQIAELVRITGTNSGSEALRKLRGELKDNVIGDLAGLGLGALQATTKARESILGYVGGKMGASGIENLLSGSKIDFPQVWKGANFQTGYTVTVRLYNPFPENVEAYAYYILIPLIRLLAFVTPKSDEGSITYNMPVLCKVNCTGLWHIHAGFVSSIEVIKGGESNDISFRQHPGMMDVRISFGELYNVIATNDKEHQDRPTLKKYMSNLIESPESDLRIWGSGVEVEFPETTFPATTAQINDPTETVPSRINPITQEYANGVSTNGTAPSAVTSLNTANTNTQNGASQTNSSVTTITGQIPVGNMIRGTINGESNPLHEDLVDEADSSSTVGQLRDNTVTTAQKANELATELALHTIRELRDSIMMGGFEIVTDMLSRAIDGRYNSECRDAINELISNLSDQWLNVKGCLPDAFASALRGATATQIGVSLRLGRMGIFNDGVAGNVIQETLTAISDSSSNFKTALVWGAASEVNNFLDALSGIQAELSDGTISFKTYSDEFDNVYYSGASQQKPNDLELSVGTREIAGATPGLSTLLWSMIPDTPKGVLNQTTGATKTRLTHALSIKDMIEIITRNPTVTTTDALLDIVGYIRTTAENRLSALQTLKSNVEAENVGGALDDIISDITDIIGATQLKIDDYEEVETNLTNAKSTCQSAGLI